MGIAKRGASRCETYGPGETDVLDQFPPYLHFGDYHLFCWSRRGTVPRLHGFPELQLCPEQEGWWNGGERFWSCSYG